MKFLSVFLVVVGFSIKSHAWREAGHFTVCEVAYRFLSQKAKASIDLILDGKAYAEQCTWPDMVRKTNEWKHTYTWHFINLDDQEEYFHKDSINPNGDIMQALLETADLLKSSVLRKDEKLIQLRFLGHLVGDVHQPLHIGRRTDLGGNKIKVKWFGKESYNYKEVARSRDKQKCVTHKPTGECVEHKLSYGKINLHKVWDLHMIEKFSELEGFKSQGGDSEYMHLAYTDYLLNYYSDLSRVNSGLLQDWQHSIVLDWAQESLCFRKQGLKLNNSNLGQNYYFDNIGLVNERLVQGGVRLAGLLNRVFDSSDVNASKRLLKREENLKRALKILKSGGVVNDHSLSTGNCEKLWSGCDDY